MNSIQRIKRIVKIKQRHLQAFKKATNKWIRNDAKEEIKFQLNDCIYRRVRGKKPSSWDLG